MTAVLVIAALVVAGAVGLWYVRRRRTAPLVLPPSVDRYQIVVDNCAVVWSGNDSREASVAIAELRKHGKRWHMLVDGVEKKRGL